VTSALDLAVRARVLECWAGECTADSLRAAACGYADEFQGWRRACQAGRRGL